MAYILCKSKKGYDVYCFLVRGINVSVVLCGNWNPTQVEGFVPDATPPVPSITLHTGHWQLEKFTAMV